jgi:hypothetical protein
MQRVQQIFFQDTMELRIFCLFNCILHKRKINQNTLRFSIIARDRNSKFKNIKYQGKEMKMKEKLLSFIYNWTTVTSVLC